MAWCPPWGLPSAALLGCAEEEGLHCSMEGRGRLLVYQCVMMMVGSTRRNEDEGEPTKVFLLCLRPAQAHTHTKDAKPLPCAADVLAHKSLFRFCLPHAPKSS